MSVARWMLLRLEERVEIPEARLNIVIRGHLGEAHLREDLAELRAHFQEGVQVAAGELRAQRLHARLGCQRTGAAALTHVLAAGLVQHGGS